jgi:hypothetical protein
MVTEDVRDKIVAAALDSKVAAAESVKTNDYLLTEKNNKRLQWVVTIALVLGFWWGAATWCGDMKNTQFQQGLTIESHSKRLDSIDDKMSRVQTDTSYMRGVISSWQNGLLQPVTQKHIGAR